MKGPSTEVIHRGEGGSRTARPLTLPIYETTTFLFESAAEVRAHAEGRSDKFLYSRYANPTVQAVEEKLAQVERAEAAVLMGSGMAATATALMALLSAGDEVVCSSAIYGGTLRLLADVLPRFGVASRFVRPDDLADATVLVGPRTKVVWFESPINPTLRCVDVAAVARICREAGCVSILDNTFATPVNQQPIALGVDLVMHSATKYLNGHSDVTAGVVAGSGALVGQVWAMRKVLGSVLDPQAAYALGRGLKTLAVRVARHNENAMAVARWLESDRRVARVFYPGLESHPDHKVALSQMSGFGGMVCVELDGGLERASRLFDRLQVFQRAASLGGVESLCSLPVLTSHWGHSEERLRQAGVTAGMVRLSVGLEDVEDLLADLDQALEG